MEKTVFHNQAYHLKFIPVSAPDFFFFLYKRKSSLIWQFILHVITYFLKESVSKVNRTVMAFNSPLTRAFKINFVYACPSMNVWDLFYFPLFTSCSFFMFSTINDSNPVKINYVQGDIKNCVFHCNLSPACRRATHLI